MKKKIFFILLFLMVIFSIDSYATSFKFVWENTLVEVPFGDSVDKYKDIPVAHLYVNDKMIEDANVTYNRDGDWLCYLKDVDSTKLKDYYVWYKAYENDEYRPGTCTDYKCKVQFKIVDKEKPVIKVLNNQVTINSNLTSFDPLSNVSIYDNCDKNLNITYSPKFEEFTNGLNTISIYATDASGNSEEASYQVNVVDSTLPYFLRIKSDELVFDLGSTPSLEGYFEAYDDIDGNISNKINYPSIKTDKVGEYKYELSVSDSSGNETKEEIVVNIKDLTIPQIELTKESDILSYKVDLKNFNYTKYVKNITDNEAIDYNNLTYETNLANNVGTYYIRYKYDDGTNLVYKDLIIKLVSYDKPQVETHNVVLPVGSYADLKEYVEVSDKSDSSVSKSIVIDDENVNYYKEGNYIASVYAINSSGISTTENIEVKIVSQKEFTNITSPSYEKDISDYINYILAAVIIVIVIGFTVFIIVLKKKKKI